MIAADELDILVAGCAENRRECQKKIYDTFCSFSMAVCERYTATRDEAVEIMNDGFLKIFREIHHYRPSYTDTMASFKGWVRKIMVYTAIDYYRKQKKHAIVTSLEASHINSFGGQVMPDRLEYEEIIKMIQRLSPAYRTVLNLFVVEGFSHEEIAGKLEISVGTSKSNLAKARKQLQKIFIKQNEILLEKNAG